MSHYVAGDWNAICDRCGAKKKASQLRLEWTGLRVCRYECFETRHPQDSVRGVPDKQNPPWVRPEPDPIYVIDFYRHEDGSIIYREDGAGHVLPLLREPS